MRGLFLSIVLLVVSSLCYGQGEPPRSDDHDHDHEVAADTVVVVDTVRLVIDGAAIVSSNSTKLMIEGEIAPFDFNKKYMVEAIDRATGRVTKLKVEYDGVVWGRSTLAKGVNYLDVVLSEKTKKGTLLVDSINQIYYVNDAAPKAKQAMVWIDQFAAAKTITADTIAAQLVRQIKDAGFSAIALEAKSAEGYASYRKNELSATPYFTATKNVRHADLTIERPTIETDSLTGDTTKIEYFDLFGAMTAAADTIGIEVYATFNFFTEGNITTRDTVLIAAHPEWETMIAEPNDSTIVALTSSARGREAHDKGNRLQYAFTNPADPAVQAFELARVREVLKNYPLSGVIISRCRYDGLDADYSEISRRQFSEFLAARGKKLDNFTAQATAEFLADWVEYRAGVIASFTAKLRQEVDSFSTPNRQLALAAYVGNWYDKYYGYGVNWASPTFTYNDLLDFEHPEIYTESYATTSLLRSLNFLIIGSFRKTIARDVALAQIITEGQIPLVVALRMPQQMSAVELLHAAEASSAGIALLELSRITALSSIAPMIEGALPKPMVKTKKK